MWSIIIIIIIIIVIIIVILIVINSYIIIKDNDNDNDDENNANRRQILCKTYLYRLIITEIHTFDYTFYNELQAKNFKNTLDRAKNLTYEWP